MSLDSKDIITDNLDPIYDNLTECILEIEELKNELTTIVMTQTSNSSGSRERWDTPETKISNGKKGRLRKDRYSALLMANASARQISRTDAPFAYDVIGSTKKDASSKEKTLYRGPSWFMESANQDIYLGIYKK